jgi:hypothetical protein
VLEAMQDIEAASTRELSELMAIMAVTRVLNMVLSMRGRLVVCRE